MTRLVDDPVEVTRRVLGIEPHEGQRAYLRSTAKTKVLVGGRRAGKTKIVAAEVCAVLARARADQRPTSQLIVAPAVDQARLLFNEVGRILRASTLAALVEQELATPFPELRIAGGSRVFVRAGHDGGRHLRGHAADRVVVDEAAYMADQVIEEAILPILADVGGQLVLASTPAGMGCLFHRLYERGQRGGADVASFLFRTLDNPHVDHAYVARQRGELSPIAYATEFEGRFLDPSAAPIGWAHVTACAVGAAEGPRPGGRYLVAWDPARRKDRSAVVVVDEAAPPRRVVHVEDVARLDYVAQVERVADIVRAYGAWAVAVDGGGLGDPIVDMLRERSINVLPVVLTTTSRAAALQTLIVAIETRGLIFPPDPLLMDELRGLRTTRTATGHVRYEAGPGAHDDFVMALAFAVGGGRARASEAQLVPAFLMTDDDDPDEDDLSWVCRGRRVVPDPW